MQKAKNDLFQCSLPFLCVPHAQFRYNPLRRGEMAEWLKAAVC